ncbi:MAG TPA: hypothetical protein VK387_05680 [Thermoleophilaceae bacterium]|nr:hypothetical protein [Thermoleophilaceae bacterium]
MRKLAAILAGLALAVSAPAAALADHGERHGPKGPCPTVGKQQGNGPKKTPKNNKGRKCGFQKAPGPVGS